MVAVTKDDVKAVLDDPDLNHYEDGAYWCMVHDILGLEYGDVFDIIAADPEFFGYKNGKENKRKRPESRRNFAHLPGNEEAVNARGRK